MSIFFGACFLKSLFPRQTLFNFFPEHAPIQMEMIVMPYAPLRPCRYPGCVNKARKGKRYCQEHSSEESDLNYRDNSSARGYNSRWHKARTAYLHAHPFCVKCMEEGRYTKATVVDHIRPHRGDQALFWDRSNWQSLCKQHHDEKTGKEDRRLIYEYKF